MHDRRARRMGRDRGQVTPLIAVAVMGAALAVVAIAHLGGVVVDRARARNAADAAALAGARAGRAAAEQTATANGATLERWRQADGATEVTVRVGHARATARARLTTRDQPAVRARPTSTQARSAPLGGVDEEASPRLAR